MKKCELKNIIWKEGKYSVAWNLNTGVSSFGNNKKEALANLNEALCLYFEDNESSLNVIVPDNRKEIPRGTFLSILNQSHLSERDFVK
jgi:predicted RNase H-like HicB family nuclease